VLSNFLVCPHKTRILLGLRLFRLPGLNRLLTLEVE